LRRYKEKGGEENTRNNRKNKQEEIGESRMPRKWWVQVSYLSDTFLAGAYSKNANGMKSMKLKVSKQASRD
jgi:hypothetical protein